MSVQVEAFLNEIEMLINYWKFKYMKIYVVNIQMFNSIL